jgi:triacylglycerol esterase/lipase EstA (alpha/beta hydrolase family)
VAKPFTFPSAINSIFGPSAAFWTNRGRNPYQSTVLVGHSAGGLIIRETINLIVNAFEQDKNAGGHGLSTGQMMVLKSKVRFFAPAHRGFQGS